MRWKVIALLLPWLLAGAFTAYAIIVGSRVISNCGRIHVVGLEVYWDSECTKPCYTIDWGWLYPGDSAKTTVYAKIIGNTPVTLSISVGNWTPPEAGNFIAVTWDYNGRIVNPNDVLPITFILSVSYDITGIETFEFDIVITATG